MDESAEANVDTKRHEHAPQPLDVSQSLQQKRRRERDNTEGETSAKDKAVAPLSGKDRGKGGFVWEESSLSKNLKDCWRRMRSLKTRWMSRRAIATWRSSD